MPSHMLAEVMVGDGESAPARKKVAFLIDEIASIADGGTERQILQLVRLAQRLGYEPSLVILRGTEWLDEEQAGCRIYSVGIDKVLSLRGLRACRDLVLWLRKERIALVQTFFKDANILGPVLARMAGVPVVIGTRRNLNHGMTPGLLLLQRVSNFGVHCILANSNVVAEVMGHSEWVPRRKLRVAYNGIDLVLFRGLERFRFQMRRKLGIADDELLVGNVSGLRWEKGILQFVDAARQALQREPRLRFVVVGDGEQRDIVAARIREHGIEDRFHLAGAQVEVRPYLAAMDIGVLSSLAEGFSNSLLEYMAAGLPTIATDVGGNREALADSGVLVLANDPATLADAILGLRNAEDRLRFGDAARLRVERFSLARAEQRMKEIYDELLDCPAKKVKRNLKEKVTR